MGYCNLITRPLDDCELKTCKQHSRALRRHTAVTDGTHLQPQAAQKIMNRLLKEGRGVLVIMPSPPPLFFIWGEVKKKEKKRQKEGKKGGGGCAGELMKRVKTQRGGVTSTVNCHQKTES